MRGLIWHIAVWVICSVFCSGDFTDGIRIQEAATADYEWTEYDEKDVLQLRFEVPPQAEQKQLDTLVEKFRNVSTQLQ